MNTFRIFGLPQILAREKEDKNHCHTFVTGHFDLLQLLQSLYKYTAHALLGAANKQRLRRRVYASPRENVYCRV